MNFKTNIDMNTLKKVYTTIAMSLLLVTGFAQSIPQVAIFDNVGSHSEDGDLHLSWINLSYDDASYFIVEKLDENWDYVAVGQIEASPSEVIYTIVDDQPVLGENYYRITVVTEEGSQLVSELLVQDHFMEEDTFLPMNNNTLLAQHTLQKVLYGSELIDSLKYNKHQLQMARIKSTATFTEAYTSTLVASIDFLD